MRILEEHWRATTPPLPDTHRDWFVEEAPRWISYLADAIDLAHPRFFIDYMAWMKIVAISRGIQPEQLARQLSVLSNALGQRLAPREADATVRIVGEVLAQLPSTPVEPMGAIPEDAPQAALARTYLETLLKGERQAASALILRAADSGVSVKDIYLEVFQPVMHEIGRLWQQNRIGVAMEHYCTAATQMTMSQLYPRIFSTQRNGGSIVAACATGELHELGVRMVSDFFEMDGWDTFYLGANSPEEAIVDTLRNRNAQVLALSATLVCHLAGIRKLIRRVRSTPGLATTRIMLGGHPFATTPGLWREFGADGHACDARQALELGSHWLKGGAA